MMHAELQATCSALGYLEDGQYFKEPDCLGKTSVLLFMFDAKCKCLSSQLRYVDNVKISDWQLELRSHNFDFCESKEDVC